MGYTPYFAGHMRVADLQVTELYGNSSGDVNDDVMVCAVGA